MSQTLTGKYRAIDVDTHLSEPADLWTSRVASKWRGQVPRVVPDPDGGPLSHWAIGDELVLPAGLPAMAGFDGTLPDCPATVEDGVRASYDARARLDYMDSEGIWAQVLYPNVGGFGSGSFLKLGVPELMLECVRVYNDYLVEWASEDPERLLPVMSLPFWDVEASVAEIHRSAQKGHRAILFGSRPSDFGEPPIESRHWEPIFAAAQEARLSISFHIGSGETYDVRTAIEEVGIRANLARLSSQLFIDNMRCMSDLIMGGVCHRFPELDFVSVESGVGWLPFALDAFDWQWQNGAVRKEHPEYDLLPSEYFARQIYSCFWFEESGLQNALDLYGDNIMWETDFPHPTSMSPGPQSIAERPSQYVDRALAARSPETLEKVLHGTAARLYSVA